MGIERLLLLVHEYGRLKTDAAPDIYVMQQEEGLEAAINYASRLRAAGFNVLQHCGNQSLKNQMKKADASGARFALIVGGDEAENGTATVKDLQGQFGQQTIASAELTALLTQWKNHKWQHILDDQQELENFKYFWRSKGRLAVRGFIIGLVGLFGLGALPRPYKDEKRRSCHRLGRIS